MLSAATEGIRGARSHKLRQCSPKSTGTKRFHTTQRRYRGIPSPLQRPPTTFTLQKISLRPIIHCPVPTSATHCRGPNRHLHRFPRPNRDIPRRAPLPPSKSFYHQRPKIRSNILQREEVHCTRIIQDIEGNPAPGRSNAVWQIIVACRYGSAFPVPCHAGVHDVEEVACSLNAFA